MSSNNNERDVELDAQRQLDKDILDDIAAADRIMEPALPYKFVDQKGDSAYRFAPDQPEVILRIDGGIVCFYIDGEPMGLLKSLEISADVARPGLKAKVQVYNHSEDSKKRVELMRKIPWLEIEEIPIPPRG